MYNQTLKKSAQNNNLGLGITEVELPFFHFVLCSDGIDSMSSAADIKVLWFVIVKLSHRNSFFKMHSSSNEGQLLEPGLVLWL